MGRAVAALICHELEATIAENAEERAIFSSEINEKLLARSEELDARESRLDERERSLREAERRLESRSMSAGSDARVGRNDPCPCGSGFKYKRCHGFLG